MNKNRRKEKKLDYRLGALSCRPGEARRIKFDADLLSLCLRDVPLRM
jgi:hypothetical protein